MPSILITTSRRTSNRVRAFARDLHTVIPDSSRFNRGGMSISELISRIGQVEAKAAFIITTFRGNPGDLQVFSPDGSIAYEMRMESAALRREVFPDSNRRINTLGAIATLETSREKTLEFSRYWSSLMGLDLSIVKSQEELVNGSSGNAFALLKDEGGKVHWSFHHALDGVEIGPRIRISNIRRPSNEQ